MAMSWPRVIMCGWSGPEFVYTANLEAKGGRSWVLVGCIQRVQCKWTNFSEAFQRALSSHQQMEARELRQSAQ